MEKVNESIVNFYKFMRDVKENDILFSRLIVIGDGSFLLQIKHRQKGIMTCNLKHRE